MFNPMESETHILLGLAFDKVAHVAGFPLPPLTQICVLSPDVPSPRCHVGVVTGNCVWVRWPLVSSIKSLSSPCKQAPAWPACPAQSPPAAG